MKLEEFGVFWYQGIAGLSFMLLPPSKIGYNKTYVGEIILLLGLTYLGYQFTLFGRSTPVETTHLTFCTMSKP